MTILFDFSEQLKSEPKVQSTVKSEQFRFWINYMNNVALPRTEIW